MLLVCALLPAATTAASTAVRWTPAAIASDQYESTPTFSPDGRELVFMRADHQFRNYRLLQTHCLDGAWTTPQPLAVAAAAPALDADPAITADGRQLFFVSSRHHSSNEDLDIWVSQRQADGHWGEARRLPEPVNSPAAELLPGMDQDGGLLFGSARPGGLGGGDIYRASRDADGNWQVDNLGAPVNTTAFEYEAAISADGRTLVVVADREGRSHLYRYVRRAGAWIEKGRIAARDDVFQVGPLLSPRGERLLFAQKDSAARSGEIFLVDLVADATEAWPPRCDQRRRAGVSRR